ncbi:MAG: hypothetical protein IKR34_02775 [Candidatus Gastranaerophilales bacterium]|nr:hypothetical protein [Candidatus Gastranaerophilales bacterium]
MKVGCQCRFPFRRTTAFKTLLKPLKIMVPTVNDPIKEIYSVLDMFFKKIHLW